ncbi:cytochrome c oxidase subunit 3 [Nocardia sp. CA-151230]|uniref:cytochrome c oxidase subunit 3 n=1 Tax=Nocardia sp. CA-151230 TaxID=3239982 RepID=UPI003D90F2ED
MTGRALENLRGKAPRRLPGMEGIWVFIAGDMTIFTMLFASFVTARAKDVNQFVIGQDLLDPHRGGINTLLLLSSSLFVARTLNAFKQGRENVARNWLALGVLGGVSFSISKMLEYVIVSTNSHGSGTFFGYYFALTGMHLAHVLVGTGLLVFSWMRMGRNVVPVKASGLESVAVFWHMVDLFWIILFSLLYLMR